VAAFGDLIAVVVIGFVIVADPATADLLRQTAHALLAATDPGGPEKEQNDPIYERSIHHLVPSGALESDNLRLRHLIINQVRRLHLRGGFAESLSLGQAALDSWRRRFPADDIQTLALAVEIGIALRLSGRTEEAYALDSETLECLLREHGPEDETYLICANSFGQDLRYLGRYDEALAHDLDLLPTSGCSARAITGR
jgi:hypothetical protein